jgi:hypothetical protein
LKAFEPDGRRFSTPSQSAALQAAFESVEMVKSIAALEHGAGRRAVPDRARPTIGFNVRISLNTAVALTPITFGTGVETCITLARIGNPCLWAGRKAIVEGETEINGGGRSLRVRGAVRDWFGAPCE